MMDSATPFFASDNGNVPVEPNPESGGHPDHPNLRLWVVPTEQVGYYWPMVREGVNDIIEKTKPTWLIEDVYRYVANGAAILLMVFEGKVEESGSFQPEEFVGFSILGRDKTQFTERFDLLIWNTWVKPAGRGLKARQGIVEFMHKKIEEYAKIQGFQWIVGYSPRLNWVPRAKRMGYEIRTIVLHKRVEQDG